MSVLVMVRDDMFPINIDEFQYSHDDCFQEATNRLSTKNC